MKQVLVIIMALIMGSCGKKGAKLPQLEIPLIQGIADPIFLDLERNVIPLEEFVSDPSQIDSITTDGPFAYQIDNSNLLLYGRPRKPLYELTLWSEGVAESILLKRTKKTLYSFLYQGDARTVKVKGDFNDWDETQTVLNKDGRNFSNYVLLASGSYAYSFVVDGEEELDPFNRDSVQTDEGKWNSVLRIPEPNRNEIPSISVKSFSKSEIEINSSLPFIGLYAYWENIRIPEPSIQQEGQVLRLLIPENARERDSSTIRLWVENEEGASNELRLELNGSELVASP